MSDASCGFPRNARLLTANDFRRVFEAACRSADECFVVFACENGNRPARLGLALAKKHVRRAVDRNRIKRLVRESFRLVRAQLCGKDFVVLARPGTAGCSSAVLRRSLESHWRRQCTMQQA